MKAKLLKEHNDSYSNLYSPESPSEKLKSNGSNLNMKNYYDHYVEKQVMTNNQNSPNGKNGVISISSTANTSVKTK